MGEIEIVKGEGRSQLTEIESKELLKKAGIPVIEAKLATAKKEAISLSKRMGFPVVLKVVSSDIIHKSDPGGIKLGLSNAAQVSNAYSEIMLSIRKQFPKTSIQGVSVQKMSDPGVEVIIGMSKDAQFGPVLMFGLGGTLVELLKDVSFRLVPVTRNDAEEMVREIKGYPLLQGYRGQEAADIPSLEQLIVKVSEFVEQYPQIEELDLNPVFACKDGAVVVDARIILGQNLSKWYPNVVRSKMIRKFEPLFAPHSIIFFGASKNPKKWGFIILANLLEGGFPGRIFPINPREEEILGLKVYRKAEHIPEVPDLAVIVVPPRSVALVLKECADKGVKAAVIITAGFAETGNEGERLQREMVQIARDSSMILVGPNCNGVMNPSSKLYAQMVSIFPHSGPIAVVAQSGNVAFSIARRAMLQGVGCSKYISTGNEADLHCEDYLEYLAEDPQTKVILTYVEGLKDGRRFYQIAKDVNKKKPIVVLKAGETPAGARAAMSHTASVAGSSSVFEAACKQAGVISTRDLDELLNAGLSFLRQPLPRGRRVGIVTAGGGWGVLAADACTRQGLEVVSLPDETIRALDSFLPSWWNRGNPVDLVAGAPGDAVVRSIETLLRSSVVDSVVLLGIMSALPTRRPQRAAAEDIEAWEKTTLATVSSIFDQLSGFATSFQKPIIVASDIPFADAAFETKLFYTLGKRDYVCYTRPHQATAALANLVRYSLWKAKIEQTMGKSSSNGMG